MLDTRPRLSVPPDLLPAAPKRRMAPAGRVLGTMLVCFLVWGLLDARELRRSAEASPIGARRMAALVVLDPLFVVSRWTGMDAVGEDLVPLCPHHRPYGCVRHDRHSNAVGQDRCGAGGRWHGNGGRRVRAG